MNEQELIGQARRVKANFNTAWDEWEYYSSRQRQRLKLGGIIGEILLDGQVWEFLPYLKLAEFIHIGTASTFGFGAVRLM